MLNIFVFSVVLFLFVSCFFVARLYCFNLPGALALQAETVFMRSHPTLHIKSYVIEMTAYMSYQFLILFERTCCGDT